MTRVGTRALLAVLTCLALVACTPSPEPGPGPSAAARVRAAGTGLILDGAPWWPLGVNAYQLGTDWSVNAGCGAQTDLDAYFGSLPPRTLTRFWLFAGQARDRTGALDFGPLDRVFAAARRHDQLLLPVLGNGEGACDGGFKQSGWYRGGWRTDTAGSRTFPEWIDTAVRRWRSEPTVAGWSLLNEAEVSDCGDAACTWSARRCPADAGAVLRSFVTDASALVRRLDPDRLLFAGVAGGGQCGAAGDDYRALSALPAVDVAEYHHYASDGATFPGSPYDGLAVRLRQAAQVGKPLFIGELGMDAGSGCAVSREARAGIVERNTARLREAGAAGVLLWSAVPDRRVSGCTMDIGPDDPVWPVVAAAATRTPPSSPVPPASAPQEPAPSTR